MGEINKLLVVLDLDETLIYCPDSGSLSYPAVKSIGKYQLYVRPWAYEFVESLLNRFNVAVWTSASADYASPIVAELFKGRTSELQFVWSRDRCTRRFSELGKYELGATYFVKNLKKVRKLGYDFDRILMLDDSPEKLELNYGNLLRMSSWRGDVNDTELKLALSYIENISTHTSIRKIDKRYWKIKEQL